MKFQQQKIRLNQLTLPQIYLLSLVAVMIFLMIQKSEFLLQTSWMAPSSLKVLESQLASCKALFLFVLKERVAIILVLFILSTTYLGNLFVHLNVVWFGACSGLFLTLVILRYGLKGVLLLLAGMFPHYLIYVPAMIITLSLAREKRVVNQKYCLQLLVILLVVIIGCILECYVNPYVLVKIIRNLKI